MPPSADGVPFYRAKSIADGDERVISELSLRPVPMWLAGGQSMRRAAGNAWRRP
jgi:hypothetical protein